MQHTQWIFGYGSLINPKSISDTLDEEKFTYPVRVRGLKRGWYSTDDQYTWLGVKRSTHDYTNGVIFSVSDDQLYLLDIRESIYDREIIENYYIEPILSLLGEPWKNQKVYVYVSKSNESLNGKPILSSYINLCLSGTVFQDKRLLSKEYTVEFLNNTFNWPKKTEDWIDRKI